MENVEYVTIRVALKAITADDGNLTVPVESIGPVCAAYWLTYGARQSVKDKIAGLGGKDGQMTALHHVVTLGSPTPRQSATFAAVCAELACTVGQGKAMTTDDFVDAISDVRKAARWADCLAEKMFPVEESRRLKGDAKMARDIATFMVRQAYEAANMKVSAATFEPHVDQCLVNKAAEIAAEVARRKAWSIKPDLSDIIGKAA